MVSFRVVKIVATVALKVEDMEMGFSWLTG